VSSTAPHQALYRRWRAQTFGQIVGQQAVVETLQNGVRSGRTAHGVLFAGPRGTGKTSLARILAKAINCTDLRDGEPCDACPSCLAIREGRTLDLFEIDAASNRGIDAVRAIRDLVQYPPGELAHKVFILDEAHQITKDAWGALLKTLEEPPEFVNFMFASTEPAGFPAAILSRLQRFDLRRLTVPEIAGKMRTILEAEGRAADLEAIDLIARLAAGGMRDAESMLDQLLATDSASLTADRVREVLGLVDEETLEAFLGALLSGEAIVAIDLLDGLEEHGRDLRAFTEQALERLRVALVASLGRGSGGGLAAAGPAALAAAARRLASIDPVHPGPGGLRLQLELAVLAPAEARASTFPPFQPVERPATPIPAQAVTATKPAGERGAPGPAQVRPAAQPAQLTPPPAPAAKSSPSGPPAPPAAPLASRSGTRPTLQLLLERWAEIVEVISKSPSAKPLIVACRPVGVEGAVVTLGFPEAQSFFKDVAERRRPILEDGVSRVLGMPVSVRCVAANVEFSALPEDTDGTRLLSEFRRIYGDDIVDVGEVG
jgi:DNA polymerase III subunit gamma/tau